MNLKSLFDKNHVIGYITAVITLSFLYFLSSQNLLQSVYGSVDGVALIVILVGVYVLRSILAIPLSILTVFVGYRYGIFIGFGIGVVGATISCVPPYFIGRYIQTSNGLIGFLYTYGESIVNVTGSFRGVVAARVSPIPTDAVSYGAGISDIDFPGYISGTIIGLIPWNIALALLGDSLEELELSNVEPSQQLIFSMTLVAVLVLAPPVYQWLSKNTTD